MAISGGYVCGSPYGYGKYQSCDAQVRHQDYCLFGVFSFIVFDNLFFYTHFLLEKQKNQSQIFHKSKFHRKNYCFPIHNGLIILMSINIISILKMDDYDFIKQTLKPNNIFAEVTSPKNKQKPKTGSTTSRSKQKQIVTSFSKKQIHSPNIKSAAYRQQMLRKEIQSPLVKKSYCESQYYIKQTKNDENYTNVKLQDQLKLKDNQLQLLATKLAKSEETARLLTQENKLKGQRIQKMQQEMNTLLAKSLKHLQIDQIGVSLSYQCEKYKQDQRRLLKMLQQTAEYEYFSKFALMDNGVQFLRLHNQTKKTSLDALHDKRFIHFCSCNKQFIPQSNFWVPEKVYSFGKQFIRERQGNLTMSELELMLYELNKIWRQREKKIVNTLKGQNSRQIQKYKRKLNVNGSSQKKFQSK